MNTRSEKEKAVANPTKRVHLESLLFGGAKLGAAALLATSFLAPKIPPWLGE